MQIKKSFRKKPPSGTRRRGWKMAQYPKRYRQKWSAARPRRKITKYWTSEEWRRLCADSLPGAHRKQCEFDRAHQSGAFVSPSFPPNGSSEIGDSCSQPLRQRLQRNSATSAELENRESMAGVFSFSLRLRATSFSGSPPMKFTTPANNQGSLICS